MKKVFLAFLLVALLTMPALAQDAATQKCDTDSIKSAVDDLIANYLAVKKDATDAAGALQAAQDLQDGVASLTAGCAGVTPEATSEAESASSTDISSIKEGKWYWSFTPQTCPGAYIPTIAINRPVILKVDWDSNRIVLEDIFIFGTAEFNAQADGTYGFTRYETANNGGTYGLDYAISEFTPTQIKGATTDPLSYPRCQYNQFQLVLVDENIICMVGSEQGAGLRSGPGTTFDRLGKLDAKKLADVIGQATSDDGSVWWKLADGGWVRSDVVQEAGDCESVPQATP